MFTKPAYYDFFKEDCFKFDAVVLFELWFESAFFDLFGVYNFLLSCLDISSLIFYSPSLVY